jgi:hypothetical protein
MGGNHLRLECGAKGAAGLRRLLHVQDGGADVAARFVMLASQTIAPAAPSVQIADHLVGFEPIPWKGPPE